MSYENYWVYESESTKLDKELAKQHSPDLSKLNRIVINDKLTIYVTDKKLKKFGKEYFIEKYKNK